MVKAEYILLDKVYGNYISFQNVITKILNDDNAKEQLDIVEIGTGTGITTQIVLNSKNKIKLSSIDIDEEMIGFAKQNLSTFSNINFIVSDALSYLKTSSNNHYDYVISGFTIHNFNLEYRQELFTEIFRVLKPNGLFINVDKFVSDDKDKQIEGLKYRLGTYIDTLIREEKFELLKEWATHYIDDQKPDKLLKFDKTQKDLHQVGFYKVDYIFKSELEMLGILTAAK